MFTFNVRETRLDAVAAETTLYTPGEAVDTARALLNALNVSDNKAEDGIAAIANAIAEASYPPDPA